MTLVKAFTLVPPASKPLVEFLYKRLGENLALLSTSVWLWNWGKSVGIAITTMDNRVPPQQSGVNGGGVHQAKGNLHQSKGSPGRQGTDTSAEEELGRHCESLYFEQ